MPLLARYGASLARLHHELDDRRFVALDEVAFDGFFREQLGRADALLLVAEIDGAPVGYAFVRDEEASLEDLRGRGTWLHDLYVEPAARRTGVGRTLVEAAMDTARARGSTSLMLGASPRNEPGRRLFERMGLRPTMVEMRVDFDVE